MAEYRAKGLFEAMQASKGAAGRPAAPVAPRPPPEAGAATGPGVGESLSGAGSWVARVATGRTLLMASLVIVVALGLIWGGKALLSRHEGWAADREKPSVETVAGRPVDERLAEPPVPAVSEPAAETAAPPENRLGGLLPQTGDMPAIGSSAAGPFRIRVLWAPVGLKDEVEKERRKLAAGGVETVAERRGNGYIVYTAETFATADGEDTAAALKKIRALGYASAFTTRKPAGNR